MNISEGEVMWKVVENLVCVFCVCVWMHACACMCVSACMCVCVCVCVCVWACKDLHPGKILCF